MLLILNILSSSFQTPFKSFVKYNIIKHKHIKWGVMRKASLIKLKIHYNLDYDGFSANGKNINNTKPSIAMKKNITVIE